MTCIVLLVEDDPISQLSFQVALSKASVGVSIRTVNNGAQAKSYLEGKGKYSDRARYPTPEIILTDVNMPCLSGIELLAWIKQHPELKHIPVVVMSSLDEPEQVQLAMELGAVSYFTKLSPIENLIRLVESLALSRQREYVC